MPDMESQIQSENMSPRKPHITSLINYCNIKYFIFHYTTGNSIKYTIIMIKKNKTSYYFHTQKKKKKIKKCNALSRKIGDNTEFKQQ